MAKKKSKSQKQRKNLKKKRKLEQLTRTQVIDKNEVLYNVALTNPDIFKDVRKKELKNKKNDEKEVKTINKKPIVISKDKNKATKIVDKSKTSKKIVKKVDASVKKPGKFKKLLLSIKSKNEEKKKEKLLKKQEKDILKVKKEKNVSLRDKKNNKDKKDDIVSIKFKESTPKKVNNKLKKTKVFQTELPKFDEGNIIKDRKKRVIYVKKGDPMPEFPEKPRKKHPILSGINYAITLLFNACLLSAFVVLLIGAIRVDVFSKDELIFASSLIGFLTIIALSYNKYFSGKLLSVILIFIMLFGINKLQYDYDFFHNLNSSKYEYKNYYLVGFDTPQNINAYSVNDKNVGMLDYNTVNVQRKLNTKLTSVNYVIYESEYTLYNALYDNKVRALILTENEYRYLTFDAKNHSDKGLKVLYEFKVNTLK